MKKSLCLIIVFMFYSTFIFAQKQVININSNIKTLTNSDITPTASSYGSEIYFLVNDVPLDSINLSYENLDEIVQELLNPNKTLIFHVFLTEIFECDSHKVISKMKPEDYDSDYITLSYNNIIWTFTSDSKILLDPLDSEKAYKYWFSKLKF